MINNFVPIVWIQNIFIAEKHSFRLNLNVNVQFNKHKLIPINNTEYYRSNALA